MTFMMLSEQQNCHCKFIWYIDR